MKRVDGGWLLTDSEVEAIVMNQLGMQLGEASVLTLATPQERAVLDAMAAVPESTARTPELRPGCTTPEYYEPAAPARTAELARRGLKP